MPDIAGLPLYVMLDGKLVEIGKTTKSRLVARGRHTITFTIQIKPNWPGLWKLRAARK